MIDLTIILALEAVVVFIAAVIGIYIGASRDMWIFSVFILIVLPIWLVGFSSMVITDAHYQGECTEMVESRLSSNLTSSERGRVMRRIGRYVEEESFTGMCGVVGRLPGENVTMEDVDSLWYGGGGE